MTSHGPGFIKFAASFQESVLGKTDIKSTDHQMIHLFFRNLMMVQLKWGALCRVTSWTPRTPGNPKEVGSHLTMLDRCTIVILLMAGIPNNHLGCMKPYK